MIVAGLRRDPSTIRSRSWPADQRVPAPARLGARSPWNFSSGNGPLWQRMQVLKRLSTRARPRVASPGAPVSELAMASPTTTYGCKACATAVPGWASAATASHVPIWIAELAKGARRDGLVPGLCICCFARANVERRIDRAGAAAFDLVEQTVLRRVDAGQREG